MIRPFEPPYRPLSPTICGIARCPNEGTDVVVLLVGGARREVRMCESHLAAYATRARAAG